MDLHEEVMACDGNLFTVCVRVAGGWIYNSYDKGNKMMGSVFVPFDNEFQLKKDEEKYNGSN